ncbi:MAG: hypothetical protein O2U61_01130 [Candidatus Bathyarchaeota archaeon]|nr:hypothetical protein [Candidatus Bathyarchaeota archaeon]
MKDYYGDIDLVGNYMYFFNSGITENKNFPRVYELQKNLSYNSQYLEHISNCLETKLHTTVRVMYTKTFVITGMGIIETILYYFLKSIDFHRTSTIKEVIKIKSNEKNLEGKSLVVHTTIYEKSEPFEIEMNLSQMIDKTQNRKIFGNNNNLYPKLKNLKNLRNKIHLYDVKKNLDHDLNSFDLKELELMKGCLKDILFSECFRLPDGEKKKLFSYL